VTVEQDPVLAVPFHGACQHLAFGIASDGCQVFHGFAVIHPGDVLLDDGAFIQMRSNVVGGGTDQFDAAFVGL
jgi:hypothetical protein